MKKLLSLVLFFTTSIIFAQNEIRGVVIDNEIQAPLPGTEVTVKKTGEGGITNFDGYFSIKTKAQSGKLIVSFIGFKAQEIPFNFNGKSVIDLGTIELKADNESLSEIVIVGEGVIDIAKERETPVAVSSIREDIIREKVGNLEFPEILNKTPSIYATKVGGGFGDSRLSVRGFDQNNIAVIINGQPVNDMENGKVYWSNWSGLSDVASAIQVQRGLGSSKLAVPSVGGTINIVTKSADKKEGGFVKTLFGNDNFIKSVINYNTGLGENGWSASFLFGRWEGDGYVDGTKGEGYSYLTSIGYKASEQHNFNFTLTGSAQWHNQRRSDISIRDYFHFGGDNFRKFNSDWGYKEGKEYNVRRNFYNKPIASFNWDWKINDNLSLSTVIYGSWGRGGGTRLRGKNYGISPYKQDLTSAIEQGKLPFRDPKTGLIEFDKIVEDNRSGQGYTEKGPYKGKHISSNGYKEHGINPKKTIRSASMNSHDWYGGISNLKYTVNDWAFGAGIDLRAYQGDHYMIVNDLLGLDGYYSSSNKHLLNGVIVNETYEASPFKDTGITGQKISHYNVGYVKWVGFNGIIEYNSDVVSAVIQGGISNQSYKRYDYFKADNPESDTANKIGGFGKGGINLNIDDQNNIFANVGYIKRQPVFGAIFPNYKNDINDKAETEDIFSVEAGYGLNTSVIDVSLNAYRTVWSNRFISREVNLTGGVKGSAEFRGVAQRHQGVELETKARIATWLNFNGMLSIGNWVYTSNVKANVFDDKQQPLKNENKTLYIKDAKVGNAAQFTANLGLEIKPIKNLSIDASWQYVDELYADFDLQKDDTFLNENNLGAIKLPAYYFVDAGASYKFDLTNKTSLSLRLNVNNVLDTVYIAESSSNIRSKAGDKTYKGIDERNYVWFGFGRTWNAGLTFTF